MEFRFIDNKYISELDYGSINIDITLELSETKLGYLREELKILPDQDFFFGKILIVNYYDKSDKIFKEYSNWNIILNDFLSDHLLKLVDDALDAMETKIRSDRKKRLISLKETNNNNIKYKY
jgi:hypothetical protein